MKQAKTLRYGRRALPWLLAASFAMAGSSLRAQPNPPPLHIETRSLRLGAATTVPGPIGSQAPEVLSSSVVAEKAPWMRILFGAYNLGQASYVTLTSAEDGSTQRLNARSMKDWEDASAIFNGERVDIELHVAPGEEGIFLEVKELVVGEWLGRPIGAPPTESLCGVDNRVDSTDARVGRLFFGGCTAFLVNNGAVLTAGHCTDFDPDRDGPLLPDGVRDLSGVVEFNIPKSRTDGTTVAANANDQYPIDTGNVSWNFDGENQGLGKDYSVFGIRANSNTGLRAHRVRGFFRMTNLNPAVGDTIRITGCGVDDGTDNCSLQTATGAYVGETINGTDYYQRYSVDTTGANSGSPIIHEASGILLGIHTNAGCTSSGGSNGGTSFEYNPLETAVQGFGGGARRYVDLVSASAAENGLIFNPFNSVTEGVTSVPTGGRLVVVAGTYTKAAGNTMLMGADGKSFLIEAPVGTVTIGN